MNGTSPRTVIEVGEDMAGTLGLKWPQDRAEIVLNINRYREFLYDAYGKFKLFDTVTRCFCPTRFCTFGQTYHGFTLPFDMDGIVAAWESNEPVRLRSRWWEAGHGIENTRSGDVELIRLPQTYPTERDVSQLTNIGISSESRDDRGKTVVMVVKIDGGQTKELIFRIGDSIAVHDVLVTHIESVTLPSKRVGGVTVHQMQDDLELSRYSPYERNVPSYARYKVPLGCVNRTLVVQGTRKYHDVWWDTDIVEIGSRLLVEAMGRYFRYRDSKDPGEVRVAAAAIAEATGLLNGITARSTARSHQDTGNAGRKIDTSRMVQGQIRKQKYFRHRLW